jgi:hypothetical protein
MLCITGTYLPGLNRYNNRYIADGRDRGFSISVNFSETYTDFGSASPQVIFKIPSRNDRSKAAPHRPCAVCILGVRSGSGFDEEWLG